MTDRRPASDRTAAPLPATAGPGPGPASARKKPGFMPTVLLSLASFAVIFVFLAFQLNSGNDPALGKSALAANDPAPARATGPIVHRRIIKTRIVHLPPRSGATSPDVPDSITGTGSSTITEPPTAPVGPAPVTSTS